MTIGELLIAKINKGREDQRQAAEELARLEAQKLESALSVIRDTAEKIMNLIDTQLLLKVIDKQRDMVGGMQDMPVRDENFGAYAKAREMAQREMNEKLDAANIGIVVELKLNNGKLVLDIKRPKSEEGETT